MEPTVAVSRRVLNGPSMLGMFWTITAIIATWGAFNLSTAEASFTGPALLIAASALLPGYLWCARLVPGLPVFPIFASTFLITHVFPFLHPSAALLTYSGGAAWTAAWTVSAFLALTTAVWWICVTRPRRVPLTFLSVGGDRGHALYVLILAAAAALSIATNANWFSQLSEGVFTALRGFIRGLTGVAILMLAMSWGQRKLSPASVKLFVTFFLLYSMADGASLFLVGVIVGWLMLGVGFALGRGRLPTLSLVMAIAILGVLHIGKGPMRERYWPEGGQGHVIQPAAYPALYAEWLAASLEELRANRDDKNQWSSILSRANGVYLLLQVQALSPDVIPYLGGSTYSLVPSSLLPRFFFPDKTSPHLGSAMLNVQYGNQTWEGAQSTTIGWGLLNESIGNFGNAGWIGLALCIGLFYGGITRLGIGLPPDALPSLVGVFTMGFALQTEWTASVFISSYVQGLASFLSVAFVFAKRIPLDVGSHLEHDEPAFDESDARCAWQ